MTMTTIYSCATINNKEKDYLIQIDFLIVQTDNENVFFYSVK